MGPYDLTIGLLLVGVFFNTYLFGLVTFQFITYYTSGFKDPLYIRVMVPVLAFTDTFHSISLIYMIWVYCVTNFTNPERLQFNLWPCPFTYIANAVTAVLTHFFLVYRIYSLTGSRVLYGFICILAVAVFITGVTSGIKAWMTYEFIKLIALDKLVTSWVCLQVILDSIITSILVIRLLAARSHFKQTNAVLYRLIRGAVQTGLFCSIFALGVLISFLVVPKTNLFSMFAFPIGRIYTNTLMDTLNTRAALRGVLDQSRVDTAPLFTFSQSQSESQSPPQSKFSPNGTKHNGGVLNDVKSMPSNTSFVSGDPKHQEPEFSV